ncbi:MAG: imidazolonepropionase [Burkholderiales bacterium]|nr:imidazolonepropionase [Burkholderiales bacterium]
MPRPVFDQLWTNARIATMCGDDLGMIEHGAIASQNERITWVGFAADAPIADAAVVHDCAGALMTPGLIDCHTHLVFAGNRAQEFEMRVQGATYEDIAKAGGGIQSTVSAVREATESALLQQSEQRLHVLMREGVTTIEIKSGYGLDLESELKMLRVVRELGRRNALGVVTTFLGLHALPAAFAGRADDYVDHVCGKILPVIAGKGMADAVDAFCDEIGFTQAQTQRFFETARRIGLPVKLHAEQLSNQQGAALAGKFGALSADHLEHLDVAGVDALAKAGTVAVLLPGAFYVLRETKLPPIDALRKAGVPIAVASDLNPGTSPIVSLQANMHLACTLFRLTPTEVLRGVTVNAARALGLQEDRGSLAVGKRADWCVWSVAEPAELCYWMGGMKPDRIVAGGKERK